MFDTAKSIQKLISESETIRSPAFIYSSAILKNNLTKFNRELSKGRNDIRLLYSVKTCMHPDVIKEISNKVFGFSISSIKEYSCIKTYCNKRVFSTGFDYEQHTSVSNEIFYFNSILQLRLYLSQNPSNKTLEVGVRLRPPKSLASKQTSRFGLTLDQIYDLKELHRNYNFKISSILIHQENKVRDDAKKLRDFISVILCNHEFKELKSINLGGGWDNLFIKSQIGEFINSLSIPNNYCIYVEPGSALVRTIGILKATVIDEIYDSNKRIVVLNTSQFNNSSWYIPRIIANTFEPCTNKLDTYVYGDTCYEGDYFGKYLDSNVSIDSDVIMYPVGAYYYTTHRELHSFKFPKEYYI